MESRKKIKFPLWGTQKSNLPLRSPFFARWQTNIHAHNYNVPYLIFLTGTTDVIPDTTYITTAATPLLNDVTIGTSLIAEEDDETITVPVPVSTLSSTEFTGDVIPNATTRTKVDDEVITEGPSPGVTHATTVTRFTVDVTSDVTTLNIDDESDKTTNDIGNGFLTTDYPDENSLEEIDGRLVNTKDDHTVNLELKKDIYGNRIPENNDPNVSNYTRPLNGKEDDKDLSHVGLGISMSNGITIAGSQFDVSQNITAQPTNTVETGKEVLETTSSLMNVTPTITPYSQEGVTTKVVTTKVENEEGKSTRIFEVVTQGIKNTLPNIQAGLNKGTTELDQHTTEMYSDSDLDHNRMPYLDEVTPDHSLTPKAQLVKAPVQVSAVRSPEDDELQGQVINTNVITFKDSLGSVLLTTKSPESKYPEAVTPGVDIPNRTLMTSAGQRDIVSDAHDSDLKLAPVTESVAEGNTQDGTELPPSLNHATMSTSVTELPEANQDGIFPTTHRREWTPILKIAPTDSGLVDSATDAVRTLLVGDSPNTRSIGQKSKLMTTMSSAPKGHKGVTFSTDIPTAQKTSMTSGRTTAGTPPTVITRQNVTEVGPSDDSMEQQRHLLPRYLCQKTFSAMAVKGSTIYLFSVRLFCQINNLKPIFKSM